MENNQRKNSCKTYFTITGDFNANEIIQKLGIVPDKAWNKGEINKRTNRPYNFSRVSVGTVVCDNQKFPYRQAEETIRLIQDKKDVIIEIVKTYKNLNVSLVIVPEIEDKYNKPVLSPTKKVMDFCNEIGAEIDVDYYLYF